MLSRYHQATKDGKTYTACFDLILVTVVMNLIELMDEIMREHGWESKTATLEQFLAGARELRGRVSLLCKWDHEPPKKTQAQKEAVRRSKRESEKEVGGKGMGAGEGMKDAGVKEKCKEDPSPHKWAWGQEKADDELLMFLLGWFFILCVMNSI